MRALPWLLAACLLAVGCGGAATAATPRPEYETIVTDELNDIAAVLAELEGVSEYDQLVDRLEEAEEVTLASVERLHEIEPPDDVEVAHEALVAALTVLAEDFHHVAETLTTLQEEGMPPEYPALIETLGAIRFETDLLKDALLQLRNEGIEPGGLG